MTDRIVPCAPGVKSDGLKHCNKQRATWSKRVVSRGNLDRVLASRSATKPQKPESEIAQANRVLLSCPGPLADDFEDCLLMYGDWPTDGRTATGVSELRQHGLAYCRTFGAG